MKNIATKRYLRDPEWPENRAFYTYPLDDRCGWFAPARIGLPRLTGVEIEVIIPGLNGSEEDGEDEHVPLSAALRKVFARWRVSTTTDGSLPADGIETRTAPALGIALTRQVADLHRALRWEGAEVDDSCGLHIHVDTRDFTTTDVLWVWQAWRAVQPAAMLLIPRARRRGPYCRPYTGFPPLPHHVRNDGLARTSVPVVLYGLSYPCAFPDDRVARKSVADHLNRCVRGERNVGSEWIARNGSVRYHDARYFAMNIHSHFYRGTIEFRLAPGTPEVAETVSWARLWQALVAWSACRSQVARAVEELHTAMDAVDYSSDVAPRARVLAARTLYHVVAGTAGRFARELRDFLVDRWQIGAPRWFDRRAETIVNHTGGI